jgi:hypothetical protein
MLKIRRIKKEEDFVPGIYFETLQNESHIDADVNPMFYMITDPNVFDYPKECNVLKGTRWINVNVLWLHDNIFEIQENDITSLRDMGITDTPHNNHKLYCILKGNIYKIKELTYRQIEEMAKV